MSDLQVLATGTAGARGILVIARLNGRTVATACTAPGRSVAVVGEPGESTRHLGERARAQAAELERIAETVTHHRPHQLDGEEPDQAQHWLEAGFVDGDVVAWLEAGVPWSTSAQQLRDAGVGPREVAGQYEVGVTPGLAFARGEARAGAGAAPVVAGGGRMLTIGSLFSGVGGLELGVGQAFDDLGAPHRIAWQAEKDSYARAVLAKHWPEVRRYEDVHDIDDRAERPDIICGGFPCQDLSIAGKRAGITGARSGLWSEFVRVLRLQLSEPQRSLLLAFAEQGAGLVRVVSPGQWQVGASKRSWSTQTVQALERAGLLEFCDRSAKVGHLRPVSARLTESGRAVAAGLEAEGAT